VKGKWDRYGMLFFLLYIIMLFLIAEAIAAYFEQLPEYDPYVTFTIDAEPPHIHRESRVPGLIFELKPGMKTIWRNANVSINSHGERDREYAIPKPENTYRIVGLGDSITFGLMVDQDDIFLSVLEERLGDGYEVINAGVPAYNTQQEYYQLKDRLLEYEPDMVIYNFFNNDDAPSDMLMTYNDYSDTPGSGVFNRNEILAMNLAWLYPLPYRINYFLLEHSAFYRFLNVRTYNILSKIDPSKYPENAYVFINGIYSLPASKEALRSMINLSREEGFEFVVVLHPNLREKDENIRWPEDICKEEGIPYLRLHDYYMERDVSFDDFYVGEIASTDDVHPNAYGHKVISEGLYDFLMPIISEHQGRQK
jgi:lysophospholipase L1-like esterase